MTYGFDTAWTDTRITRLKALWADGWSAGQIAAELGGITRNAVIGKVHRLGLAGRRMVRATPARRMPRAPRLTQRVHRPAIVGNTALAAAVREPEPLAELLDIPFAQRKTLLQLTEATCRWPVGHPSDADFFFCGGDAAGDAPYCAYHCRCAYETRSERQRSKPAPRPGTASRFSL